MTSIRVWWGAAEKSPYGGEKRCFTVLSPELGGMALHVPKCAVGIIYHRQMSGNIMDMQIPRKLSFTIQILVVVCLCEVPCQP